MGFDVGAVHGDCRSRRALRWQAGPDDRGGGPVQPIATRKCLRRYIVRVVDGGVAHRSVPRADPGREHALVARRLSLGLRLPAFALITAGVTIGGHVAAHGSPPPVPVTVGLVAACAVGRFAIGTRTRSFVPIAALMTIGQLAGHTVLAAAESTATVSHAAAAGHRHAPAVDAAGQLQMSPAMILAHLGVALAMAWWLSRGEALSEALGKRLAQRLVAPIAPLLEIRSPWSPKALGVHGVVTARFLLTPAPGRAPPTQR